MTKVFQRARKTFTLSAFEFISQQALDAVTAHTGQQNPFASPAPVYGLLEFDTPHDEHKITNFFEHCHKNGWVDDALIAQTEKQAKELWQLRENISESLAHHKPLKHDVAVRLEKMAEFIQRLGELFADQFPELKSVWFGHLGDGNIHINILKPDGWSERKFASHSSMISGLVYGLVKEFEGSISAEHGIGLLKCRELSEIDNSSGRFVGKVVKAKFDSQNIMNQGKAL